MAASPRQLLGCATLGLLLPALGNGLVSVGEDKGAPSGIAALIVAAVPLWIIVYRVATGDRPASAHRRRRAARLRRAGRPDHRERYRRRGDRRTVPDHRGRHPVLVVRLVVDAAARAARPTRSSPPSTRCCSAPLFLAAASRWSTARAWCRGGGSTEVVVRLGVPGGLRLGGRVHGVRLGARRRADLAGGDVRLRQPGRGGVPRLADPVRAGDARRSSSAARWRSSGWRSWSPPSATPAPRSRPPAARADAASERRAIPLSRGPRGASPASSGPARPARRARRRAGRRTGRCWPSIRSCGAPSSTTSPCSITSTRSAISTVDSRWAMMIAVRRGQDRPQRTLDQPLGRYVEARRRLVEDQHRRVGEEGPGERHQLALAGRQPPAPVGDVGVVPVRQRDDEVVGADGLGRLDDLVTRSRSGRPKRMLSATDAVEQVVLLGHHHDRRAEVVLGEQPQVDAVQRDLPGVGVVEPRHQLGQRRLAGAGRADDGDRLAGRDVQRRGRAAPGGPRRTRTARSAGSARPRRRCSGVGCSGSWHRRLLLEHAGELLQGRRGGLERVVELRDVLHRVEELAQVEQERGQHADRDVAVEGAGRRRTPARPRA